MKFYKDENGNVYAYEADGSQDAFILPGLVAITLAEADALRNPAKTLDDLRAAKNAEINQWRLKANLTTFTHSGKLVACDELSRGDIDAVQGKVARSGTFPAGFPGGWKAVDNQVIPLATVAAWDAFYDSMVSQGTENYNHAQALKATLGAATTPEQISAIVW